MNILGREIALARIPTVAQMMLGAAFRAFLKFEKPWMLLYCYFRRCPPPGSRLRLRDGGEIVLSSYPGDIVTVFVVFCKEEYGTDFAGKSILDIGANIGCFSLLACRHGCRQLVAVEPSREAVAVLDENMARNGYGGSCRTLLAAVCGKDRGTVAFPQASSPLNTIHDRAAGQPTLEVPTVTLRALLEQHFGDHLDLLKMDCEGAEIEIIAEARDEDLLKIKEIRMEFHGADHTVIQGRLHNLGFQTTHYDRPGPDAAQLWLRQRFPVDSHTL